MHPILMAMGGDVTPDALNWANISGTAVASNANQTLSGISTTGIRLHFDVTVTDGSGTLEYDVNNGANVGFVDNDTLTWLKTQTLSFTATWVSGASWAGTVSVKNASAGLVELDSFTFTVVGP